MSAQVLASGVSAEMADSTHVIRREKGSLLCTGEGGSRTESVLKLQSGKVFGRKLVYEGDSILAAGVVTHSDVLPEETPGVSP